MNLQSTVTLNNDVQMPQLGLGVFKMEEGNETENAVKAAVEFGYRHIDTAALYGNEVGVGRGIRSGMVPREEIFVTTKVWNSDLRQGTIKEAFEESLRKLDIGYIDLYLVHWPVKGHFVDAWKVMEELAEDDRVRAIGVCNHTVEQLERVLEIADIVPAVNQVELHPVNQQQGLRNFCREHGIHVEAWGPLGQGRLLDHPTIERVAKKHDVSPAQVMIRWELQHDLITIPKSSKVHRIQENGSVYHFELSDDDMEAIDALDEAKRFGPDPENFDF